MQNFHYQMSQILFGDIYTTNHHLCHSLGNSKSRMPKQFKFSYLSTWNKLKVILVGSGIVMICTKQIPIFFLRVKP